MSYLTAAIIFLAFMGLVVGFTAGGTHKDDKGLPFYQQRIPIGRFGRAGFAPRWHTWIPYALFASVGIAIVLINP